MKVDASLSMGSGIVAEKHRICLCSGALPRMFSMSSMNPMSSISSASSSTQTFIESRESVPLSIWSCILPGVPTTMSTPVFRSLNWMLYEAPP